MKILQINTVYGIGSTGKIMSDIESALKKNEHKVYSAYGRKTNRIETNIIKIGTKFDYIIHGLLTRFFDTHGLLGSKRATKKFIKKIDEFNPDVVHLHNLHGYYINIDLLFNYLKKRKYRIIWTLHDCWPFTGHCCFFTYQQCDKWELMCNNCPAKKNYPKSFFLDNSEKNFRKKKELFTGIKDLKIVTPSYWLSYLVKKSFLSEYEIKVIHNGIDTNVFKPVDPTNIIKRNHLENKFIILGVANIWEKRKGLETFLQLSEKLNKNEIIVLVGVNKKQKKKLPENIIGINNTDSKYELAQYYSAADVFINPTLEDNFPTVNLEAIACGTPIITYNTGGSKETVNNINAFIVKRNDILELLEKIETIKNNRNFYYNMVIKSISVPNKKSFVDSYLNLYERN